MTFVALLALAPLVACLLILIAPEGQSRAAALVLSLVIFIGSLGLLVGVPLETNLLWIPAANIHFHLAADGLSVWLVLLSTFLTPLAVLVSWNHID
jgi:NADH-quinone oxidoreductase subunit M